MNTDRINLRTRLKARYEALNLTPFSEEIEQGLLRDGRHYLIERFKENINVVKCLQTINSLNKIKEEDDN